MNNPTTPEVNKTHDSVDPSTGEVNSFNGSIDSPKQRHGGKEQE